MVGWMGSDCTVVKNECDPNPCNSGTCHNSPDSPSGRTCQCPDEDFDNDCFADVNEPTDLNLDDRNIVLEACDIRKDFQEKHTVCQNDGICLWQRDQHSKWQCFCSEDHHGKYCEKNI